MLFGMHFSSRSNINSSLYDVIQSNKLLYLVFEFVDGDLKNVLDLRKQQRQAFPLQIIKTYLYQILQGVAFCHARGVLHRYVTLFFESQQCTEI